MTRRQRQKRNKLIGRYLKNAIKANEEEEARRFPLRNNLGIIDPVPQQAIYNLSKYHK